MKYLIPLIFFAGSTGCATSTKINDVQLGMTKAEVISIMGEPNSVSAQGGAEYLNYSLIDNLYTMGNTYQPYYVRLIDGKVESFGKTGDFDSTKPETIRVETDENVKVDKGADLYSELRKLKELNDDGILSDEEYEELKQRAIQKH